MENACFETDYSNKQYIFYSGWETYFRYNNHYFLWWPHDSKKECDIYIMTKDWDDYIKRDEKLDKKTNTDADKYLAFNATDEMIKNPELFAKSLRRLIAESEKS